MKRAIIGITQNPPQRDTSHAAGWVKHWQRILDADVLTKWTLFDLLNYDTLYIYNDINGGPGKLNIFGFKLGNEIHVDISNRIESIRQAVEQGVGLNQLDYKQVYATAFAKRGIVVDEMFDKIPCVKQTDRIETKVVIGDSHSISVAPHDFAINRNDGKTLYGALKQGLKSFLTGKEETVIFKFGDIDMRHHICRQELPINSLNEMLVEYISQAQEIQDMGITVILCHVMAQTRDTRKIPKTGYFKGEPFYGPVATRQHIGFLFNTAISSAWNGTVVYPDYADEDGFLLESRMEAKQSFHLAPHSYLFAEESQ